MIEIRETKRGWHWEISTADGKVSARSVEYYTRKWSAGVGGRRWLASVLEGNVEIALLERKRGWVLEFRDPRRNGQPVARLKGTSEDRKKARRAGDRIVNIAAKLAAE